MARRRPTPPAVIMARLLKHKHLFCQKERERIRALELYWESNRTIPPEAMPVVWKWLKFATRQARSSAA